MTPLHAQPGPRPAGFTLVEMVISLAVVSIILLATQSVLQLAARAIPDGRSLAAGSIAGDKALDQLNGDLCFAQTVTVATATAVEFTVADRNNDGLPETIRYEWSGVAGDPLYRTYNHGTPVAIAGNVYEFALTYDKRTVTTTGADATSSEQLLASFWTNSNLYYFTINSGYGMGQYILPSLPSTATGWSITRTKILLRSNGWTNGVGSVQVRTAGTGVPTSTIIDSSPLVESGLGSFFNWQQFNFSNANNLSPYQGVCLVVASGSNDPACDVELQGVGAVSSGTCTTTTNNGSSWSTVANASMFYFLYGTVTTGGNTTTAQQLATVGCTFRVGTDSRARMVTRIRLHNTPTSP